jgi:hypothetical protein
MAKDYAQLAKRISTYTTNGLFSAVVLVAGLGFGHQVLVWWADDPSDATPGRPSTVAEGLGDPAKMHTLEFGDQPWSLARRSISGSRESAGEALLEICRDSMEKAQNGPKKANSGEPGPAQRRLIQRLAKSKPVEEKPGQWQIHLLDGPFPMVAGLDTSRQRTQSVVTWGLAVPVSEGQWTLYAMRRAEGSAQTHAALGAVPLPPNSRATMSMAVGDGSAMVTFRGPQMTETSTVGAWSAFYEKWFKDNDWQAISVWQQNGSASHASYAAPPHSTAKSVDVRLGSDTAGRFSGLLIITPKAEDK